MAKKTSVKKSNLKTFDENGLRKLTHRILSKAKKLGADAAEVIFNIGTGFSVEVRKGKLEFIDQNNGRDLKTTLYFGHRSSSTTTSDLKPEAIDLMLEKASYIAKFTCEDPFVGLADPDLMAYDYPDLDLYHPWDISLPQATELAKECEAAAFSYDDRITNSDGCSVSTAQVFTIYANSHGFLGSVASSSHNFGGVFIAEVNGDMQRDSYFSVSRNPNQLEKLETVSKKAVEKVVCRLKPQKIATTVCPVIFSADIAAELLWHFICAISGHNLYHKASFLLDQLDQQVFAKHINIDERPHIPGALGSAPFDAEGVTNKQSHIVVDGVLKRYVLDSYSARKLNLKTTGNAGGTHNLFVKTSDHDFTSLVRLMGRGLIVTELMGSGVDLINGDYSRGGFGYWVENGAIKYPVQGITIASNLRDMLKNIIAVANDVDPRSSILTGSILIDKMTVAGSK